MEDNAAEQNKRRALIGLGVALVATIGAWVFIDKATDQGLARLNHIDSVFAVCNVDYVRARTSEDTARIDLLPLIAPVDSGKEGAPKRCGDLRRPPDNIASLDSARRSRERGGLMPTRDGR
ncbi:MAG: hypothetical protein ACO1Q7_10445 [Gemmatimonas sp.]